MIRPPTIVVTGGGRGLGRAVAAAFTAPGVAMRIGGVQSLAALFDRVS